MEDVRKDYWYATLFEGHLNVKTVSKQGQKLTPPSKTFNSLYGLFIRVNEVRPSNFDVLSSRGSFINSNLRRKRSISEHYDFTTALSRLNDALITTFTPQKKISSQSSLKQTIKSTREKEKDLNIQP